MKRSPAGEFFAAPIYVFLGIVLLCASHFVFSKNTSGSLNELPNALILVALLVVPSVLSTLPAYAISVSKRRKGMSFAMACGLFCLLALLGIGLMLSLFGAGDEMIALTMKMTAILTVIFAGLEIRRPKWTES